MTDPFAGMPRRRRPAPPGALAEVVAAGGRMRSRQFLALACVPLTLALLGGLVVGMRAGGDDGPQRVSVADPTATVTPTAVPDYTESPSPSASPSPVASASASPSPSPAPTGRTAGPTAEPRPDETPYNFGGTHDDGKPGWSGGYSGCSQPEQVERRPAPVAGVRIGFEPTAQAFRPGSQVSGHVVLTNTTAETVTFRTTGPNVGYVLDDAGRALTGTYWSDAVPSYEWVIPPGDSTRVRVRIGTVGCGDGPGDPKPGLAPGSYRAIAGVGDWYADPVEVRIDPAAPTSVVWNESPRPLPARSGEPCSTDLGPSADVDASIVFEPGGTSVRSGGTLTGTLVVRATGDADGSFRLARHYSPLAFRGGSGVSPPREEGEYESNGWTRPEPHETYRFPVSIPAVTCDGTGLLPGDYDVVAGLGVIGSEGAVAGWFAAPVRVTVTAS